MGIQEEQSLRLCAFSLDLKIRHYTEQMQLAVGFVLGTVKQRAMRMGVA